MKSVFVTEVQNDSVSDVTCDIVWETWNRRYDWASHVLRRLVPELLEFSCVRGKPVAVTITQTDDALLGSGLTQEQPDRLICFSNTVTLLLEIKH